jgi:hypothetical protein
MKYFFDVAQILVWDPEMYPTAPWTTRHWCTPGLTKWQFLSLIYTGIAKAVATSLAEKRYSSA